VSLGPIEAPPTPLMRTEIGIAAQPFLNSALDEDRLDKGYVCDVLAVPSRILLTPKVDPLYLDLPRVRYRPQGAIWSTRHRLSRGCELARNPSGGSDNEAGRGRETRAWIRWFKTGDGRRAGIRKLGDRRWSDARHRLVPLPLVVLY
jgi:hypothetical protein